MDDLRKRIETALNVSEDSCPRCKHCDTQTDAVMAVIEDEAINRMAEQFVEETRIKSMDFRNGIAMDVEPSRTLVANWVGAARGMLGDAPNYSETPIEMEVGIGEDPERYAFILQRVGKLTPHEARRQAEAERDALKADLTRARALLEEAYLRRMHGPDRGADWNPWDLATGRFLHGDETPLDHPTDTAGETP